MNTLTMSGTLSAKLTHGRKAPLSWTLRNALRWQFISGFLANKAAIAFAKLTGVAVVTAELRAKMFRNGQWIDYGVLGYRKVTTAGVTALAACWADADHSPNDLIAFKYHSVGKGTTPFSGSYTAEAITDTALETEITDAGALDAAHTGRPGNATTSSGGALSATATFTFDGVVNVVEHGLFNVTTFGTGTLWDRTCFAAIATADDDTIAFTYVVTFTAGG